LGRPISEPVAQVYANRCGSRIVPDEHAVPITDNERAQEGRPRKASSPEVKPAT
jgi:hypothetical protein